MEQEKEHSYTVEILTAEQMSILQDKSPRFTTRTLDLSTWEKDIANRRAMRNNEIPAEALDFANARSREKVKLRFQSSAVLNPSK